LKGDAFNTTPDVKKEAPAAERTPRTKQQKGDSGNNVNSGGAGQKGKAAVAANNSEPSGGSATHEGDAASKNAAHSVHAPTEKEPLTSSRNNEPATAHQSIVENHTTSTYVDNKESVGASDHKKSDGRGNASGASTAEELPKIVFGEFVGTVEPQGESS
jgi:hypothetical protein